MNNRCPRITEVWLYLNDKWLWFTGNWVICRDILCGIVDTKDILGPNSEAINHFSDYTLNSLHIILENVSSFWYCKRIKYRYNLHCTMHNAHITYYIHYTNCTNIVYCILCICIGISIPWRTKYVWWSFSPASQEMQGNTLQTYSYDLVACLQA